MQNPRLRAGFLVLATGKARKKKPFLIGGPAHQVPAPGSKIVIRHRYVACSVDTYFLWVQQPSRVPKHKFRLLFSSIWVSIDYGIDTENDTETVLNHGFGS